MYVEVVIMKKLGYFNDSLTYEDSFNSNIGDLVSVSFQSKISNAIVIGVSDSISGNFDISKIKKVDSLISKSFLSVSHINLAKEMSSYYQAKIARILKMMISKKIWNGNVEEPSDVYYSFNKEEVIRGEKQKLVLETIKNSNNGISDKNLKSLVDKLTNTTLNSLLDKDLITKEMRLIFNKTDYSIFPLKPLTKKLTDSQVEIVNGIKKSLKPSLLHGVTGSGKTEIYLHLILEQIKKGKQSILLVPEIALTPQMIDYFKEYFGDYIALFHSKLNDTEKNMEWWKVKTAYAPLIIGSRSAIFTPSENLGLVIIDEEHEWTYKQESNPYYQTHKVAEILHNSSGVNIVFGSATPRIETMYKADTGNYNYFLLSERINKSDLPNIEVVDLRDEFKKKNFSIFSLSLQRKIKEKLNAKEQIILFVNQRGQASAVVCRDCGYTEECPHCSVSLKLHGGINGQKLICHYCGFTKDLSILCPECRSPYIKHVGVGTQRVENEVKKMFPMAKVLRADKETTSHKDGFSTIYRSFKNREADILIGTQMVAKGLDFEHVTLIGLILADIGLHIPDFRSHERLFQLITQVSGRCGRGKSRGEVVLQTYQPDNPAIEKSSKYNYKDFIKSELEYRKKLQYPPFGNMIKFTVVGTDLDDLQNYIQTEKEILEDIFLVNKLPVKIIVAPAMIAKIADRYYYHVLLRGDNTHIIFNHWSPPRGWRMDIDPVNTA